MNIVYFLQRENGDIKIGTTRDYKIRLSNLIRLYGDLTLMGVMVGSFDIKEHLHRQFSKYRIGRTEFFIPNNELVKFIEENTHIDIDPVIVAQFNLTETATKRIPVTPTVFEDVRDFCSGLSVNYSEGLAFLLQQVVKADEGALTAGRRLRGELNRTKEESIVNIIYFIRHPHDNYIKIGTTKNLRLRLAQLRKEYHTDFLILSVCDGGKEKERELHSLFEADWRFGEWFRPSNGLLSYIQTNTHLKLPEKLHEPKIRKMVVQATTSLINNRVPELVATKFLGGDKINLSEIERDTKLYYITISRWVKNQVNRADFPTLEVWCRYLGCTVGDLLVYEEKHNA